MSQMEITYSTLEEKYRLTAEHDDEGLAGAFRVIFRAVPSGGESEGEGE